MIFVIFIETDISFCERILIEVVYMSIEKAASSLLGNLLASLLLFGCMLLSHYRCLS